LAGFRGHPEGKLESRKENHPQKLGMAVRDDGFIPNLDPININYRFKGWNTPLQKQSTKSSPSWMKS
jgi:hypothetical protein